MLTQQDNEMNTHLNQQDWESVSKQAHKMKSPIALMGALELKELYTRIQVCAKENVNTDDLIKEISFSKNRQILLWHSS